MKVTGKIAEYAAFPTDAFGILLFSVHSGRREIALRAALRRALAENDPGFAIATAARDHSHADGPAAPFWGLWTPPGGDTVSRRYFDWPNCPNAAPPSNTTPRTPTSRSTRQHSTARTRRCCTASTHHGPNRLPAR